MAIQTGDNRFLTTTWLVDPVAGYGTHTTIQDAIDDASSGETIGVRPGTYTEDLTLKGGVSIVSVGGGRESNIILISGSHTLTTAGSPQFSGISFQTNGGTIFTTTSSGGALILSNCRIDLTDGDGFSLNGASAGVIATNCTILQSAASLNYFVITQALTNLVVFRSCSFNVIGAIAAGTSTIAAGSITFEYCKFQKQGFSTSSTAFGRFFHCFFDGNGNFTYFTTAGTSAQHQMLHCYLDSGSSSAVVVGAGTTLSATNVTVRSSAGSPISVAGTLNTTYTTY